MQYPGLLFVVLGMMIHEQGSDLPVSFQNKIGFDKFRIYVAGRNLATVTEYGGMDPELDAQRDIPLEKEYVVGVILAF